MIISLAPTDAVIFKALGQFLQTILPIPAANLIVSPTSSIEIVRGQNNRVPIPLGPDFVVMTPLTRPRLATNIDTYADCFFTASIAGTVMNVSNIGFGLLLTGATIFGSGVAANTIVTGTLGAGSYSIYPSQNVPSTPMATGIETILQKSEIVIQTDVYGPNAHDNAMIISTLFPDDYAWQLFGGANSLITPLYADEVRQMSLEIGEQQWEIRETIDLHLEINQSVVVAQQFASVVKINTISVDATYH